MSLLFFTKGGAVTNAVQLPANNFRNLPGDILPVYSGLKIDADGGLYESTPGGGWSRFATWLLAGTNTTYYASRTVIEGSLTVDAGAGPLQCNADRIYYITTNGPLKLTTVRFDLASDASGSPIVASVSYVFSAWSDISIPEDRFVGPNWAASKQ